MKTKTKTYYTPGPWITSHELGDGISIVRRISEGENLLPVAIAVFTKNYNTENVEVAKANAHIIAAAPELLEACKLAFEYPAISGDYIKDKLQNAIAKAEGK